MWVVFVEFLLQCFNKFLLASVDVFNIPKDCLQLFLCKHVSSFAALFNVTLGGNHIGKLAGYLLRGLWMSSENPRTAVSCTGCQLYPLPSQVHPSLSCYFLKYHSNYGRNRNQPIVMSLP